LLRPGPRSARLRSVRRRGRAAGRRPAPPMHARPRCGCCALVLEGGADRARAFDLLVLVVGVRHLRTHTGDHAAELARFAGQRNTVALHADGHVLFGDGAVVVAVAVDRGADVAVVPDPRATERAALGLAGRIDDAVAAPAAAAFDRAIELGHAPIAAVAPAGVGMQCEAIAG